MIDANCICMFVHNISSGSMLLMLFIISSVSCGKYFANKPCLKLFLFCFGGPVDLPPCIRHLPFAIAPFLHGLPDLVLAPQRFLAWGCFAIYIRTYLLNSLFLIS